MKRKGPPVSDAKMQANILAWYGKASAQERNSGMRWYWDARQCARHLAREFAHEDSVGAGLIAALSPGVSWEQTLRDARAIFEHKGRAKVGTYGANKAKALWILKGVPPEEILGGRKVCAFYACISNPDWCNAVCLDRHAVRAALGCGLREANLYLRRTGAYDDIAQAYCIIANKLGIMPHQLQAIVWLAFRAAENKALDEVPF